MVFSRRYRCERRSVTHVPMADDPVWQGLEAMTLVLTDSGKAPTLQTTARAFYDPALSKLFLAFWAEDDQIFSEYRHRDEPLYKQDVLECFICDRENPCRYKEFQVSPYNVQYDADVTYHGPGNVQIVVGWDFEGWQSVTRYSEPERMLTSVWALSFAGFAEAPTSGLTWRWNLYRCDHGIDGVTYSAWSPTGKLDFHEPERFGYLEFV